MASVFSDDASLIQEGQLSRKKANAVLELIGSVLGWIPLKAGLHFEKYDRY